MRFINTSALAFRLSISNSCCFCQILLFRLLGQNVSGMKGSRYSSEWWLLLLGRLGESPTICPARSFDTTYHRFKIRIISNALVIQQFYPGFEIRSSETTSTVLKRLRPWMMISSASVWHFLSVYDLGNSAYLFQVGNSRFFYITVFCALQLPQFVRLIWVCYSFDNFVTPNSDRDHNSGK